MNGPIITALAAWVPDAISLSRWKETESALRLIGHPGWDTWIRSWQPDYGHWLEAWPDAETGDAIQMHCNPPSPDGAGMVPIEMGTDLSGLAAKVANTIYSARPGDASPIDVVLFCHSSLDEHIPTTTAGRLCAEIGAPCFASSISQQQGASIFTALQLATDLFLAEPDVHTILVVAAEKWYPPFSRWAREGMMLGDAAGALLIERTCQGTGGLQLLDAETRRVFHGTRCTTALCTDWASALTTLVERLLVRHHIRPDEIDEVVGHQGMPTLTEAVCKLLHRSVAQLRHEDGVHLGAAESIIRLAQMLSQANLHRGRLFLWGFGTGGYVGAALLEACDTPHLYLQHNARFAS